MRTFYEMIQQRYLTSPTPEGDLARDLHQANDVDPTWNAEQVMKYIANAPGLCMGAWMAAKSLYELHHGEPWNEEEDDEEGNVSDDEGDFECGWCEWKKNRFYDCAGRCHLCNMDLCRDCDHSGGDGTVMCVDCHEMYTGTHPLSAEAVEA